MKYMSWTFWRFDYAMQEIFDNGDRIYQLGMFDYITEFTYYDPNLGYFDKENVSGITGNINLDVNPNSQDPNDRGSQYVWDKYMDWVTRIRAKWPHIKWFLSINNSGTYNAIKYLMDNVNNVQDVFLSEISRLIDENSWCAGIDLDLEHCGGRENADAMVNLVSRISGLVHSKGKLLHYDLPAMNGEYWSVGSENWCSYERLNPYLDSVTLMSYDFAWQGSAPSAVSPKWWLEIVYDYVSKSFDKNKVFMGLPAYGYCWQIDHYPEKNSTDWYGRFRGHTFKYMELMAWQNGILTHSSPKDSGGRYLTPYSAPLDGQPKIPFASFVDDKQKCAYMYLHVYDLQNYLDAVVTAPAKQGQYKDYSFVSTYKQIQKCEFQGNRIDINIGDYVNGDTFKPSYKEGCIDIIEDMDEQGNTLWAISSREPEPFDSSDPLAEPTDENKWGYCEFTFYVPTSGNYDIVLDGAFNWFDRRLITVRVDNGQSLVATTDKLYIPFAIRRHYNKVGTVYLSAGEHKVAYIGSETMPRNCLYGITICENFSFTMDSGKAKFRISPQTFLDVNKNEVCPENFKITLEILRREPDYCYIWSDDFRSYVNDFNIFKNYYSVQIGSFNATGDSADACILNQTSTGSSSFLINYFDFVDIYVKTQLKFGSGEAGIIIGDKNIGLQNGKLIVRNNGSVIMQYDVDKKDDMNELAVRVRSDEVKIWLNGFVIDTLTGLSGSNKAGLYSIGATYECYLFEIRDSHAMYFQEALKLTTPYGTENLGRVERVGLTPDPIFNTVYIPTGAEESDYRVTKDTLEMKEISDDWDYLHSNEFIANGDFDIEVSLTDIGFWLGKVYLCDSNGASIAFYNDIFSYMYWFNECSYKYGFKGCAIWCTGEENPLIYKYLDKEV